MTLDKNEIIETMVKAHQEATFQTISYVDTKRGIEAAFKALQDCMPPVRYFVADFSIEGKTDREVFEPFDKKNFSDIWNDATVHYLQLKNLGR